MVQLRLYKAWGVCQVNRLSQCVLVRRRNMSRCLWVAAKELHSVLVVRRGDAQSVNQWGVSVGDSQKLTRRRMLCFLLWQFRSQLLELIQKQECQRICPLQPLGFTHVSARGQSIIFSLSFSFVFSRIFLEDEFNPLQETKAVKYSVVWSQ